MLISAKSPVTQGTEKKDRDKENKFNVLPKFAEVEAQGRQKNGNTAMIYIYSVHVHIHIISSCTQNSQRQ